MNTKEITADIVTKNNKSNHEHTHEHTHECNAGIGHTHDPIHTHSHSDSDGHTHSHGHVHSDDFNKKLIARLSKAQGHLAKVKSMAEKEEDCIAVIIQLLAVKSALDSTAKFILKEHLSHCIVDAVKTGDAEAIAELQQAIDSFIK